MRIFSKKPICRLFFTFTYIASAIWLLISNFGWLNAIFSLVMLFGGYISLVKANIIKDKNAAAIDDYKFDLFSIAATVLVLFAIILK